MPYLFRIIPKGLGWSAIPEAIAAIMTDLQQPPDVAMLIPEPEPVPLPVLVDVFEPTTPVP